MSARLFSSQTVKGVLIGLVTSLLLCSGNASAQDYIGGSFGFKGNSFRTTVSSTTQTRAHSSINVAPDLGWFIGDKWAIGIRPAIGFNVDRATDNARGRTFSLEINPYAKYQMLAYNRFGFWAELDPRLYYALTKDETSDIRQTVYGVSLLPVLTYQLNRHISLESRLNLFSLSLLGCHAVSNGNEADFFNYGLSASTNDVTDTLGDISIGFLYKF